MTISKSESVQQVRELVSSIKKRINSIESVIGSVSLNVIERYSINITLNGVGVSKIFTNETIHSIENNFVELLRSVGVTEISQEGSYAEIADACLSYHIENMSGNYLEISGENIRYRVPVQVNKSKIKHSSWSHLNKNLVIMIHKLPETESDVIEANEKMNADIYEKLKESGLLSDDGKIDFKF